MTPAQREELLALMELVGHGTIDEQGVERLEQLVLASPEGCRLYLERSWLQSNLSFAEARSSEEAPHPAPHSRPVAPVVLGLRRVRDYLSQPVRFGIFFACVATLSLTLFFAQVPVSITKKIPAAAPLGTIVSEGQAIWAKGDNRSDTRLSAGPMRLQSGLSKLRLDNGVELLVEGPADFALHSLENFQLLRGRLVVRVPENAQGFRVVTPQAEIVDLGTEFGVRISDDAAEVHVQVHQGMVSVTPVLPSGALSADSELLRAGEALRVARASESAAPRLARGGFDAEFARRGAGPKFNLALSRPVIAASGSFGFSQGLGSPDHRFIPQHVVDGVTKEEIGAYWLGFEGRANEYFVIDLQKVRPLQRIELINTHNAEYNDRGSKDCELWISTEIFNGELVEPKLLCSATLPDVRGCGPEVAVQTLEVWRPNSQSLPPEARFIKFVAKTYYAAGAGLNEIRVFAASEVTPSAEASRQAVGDDQNSLDALPAKP